jgi:hypothetical protein
MGWGEMETVKHYFLYCSRFAARREQLLSLPAGRNLSENRKIEILLHGSENLGHEDNVKLMQNVQLFILNTITFFKLVL